MSNWQMVKLGDLLRRADRFEEKDELTEYRFAGTFSFGRGIFVGETKAGSMFRLPKIQRVKSGDFIYCKIMAWEGAFGVAPPEVDGCVLSGAFVVYEIDKELLDPKFLDYYFKIRSVWEQIGSQSTGTNVRRRSLHPDQFETAKIPLPPLSEQRRIVAKIEQLAAKIEEAKGLRKKIIEKGEQVCRSIILSHWHENLVPTPMEELVKWKKPDVAVLPMVTYHFAGVYCFGRGVFAGERRSGLDFSYKQLTKIRSGNFVYPKLMAWEGALAVVPLECDGLYVSPEFPVFEINTDRVLPEVLDVYFRTPAIWPRLSGSSTGTNVRRRRLNPSDFLKYEFPLPPMKLQQLLRTIKAQVDRLKALQAQTAAELEALLPSILDKAFKGEL